MRQRAVSFVRMLTRAAARLRRPAGLAFVAYSAVVLAVGLLAGAWLGDIGVKQKLASLFGDRVAEDAAASGPQVVRWAPLDTPGGSVLHDFEFVKFKLAPFSTGGRGGAIEQIRDHIVFVSPWGDLGYLSGDHRLAPLGPPVPMNLEALRADPIGADERFLLWDFRVLDLLAVETAADAFDLYASHARFADGCFELVVSRLPLALTGEGLRAASDAWEEVFVAAPCVEPDYETTVPGELWWGSSTGGRMVRLDSGTLLLSLGDQGLDGVNRELAVSQDPAAHLGKIIALDLATGAARIYASGLRNPQGLLVARDGSVWATDHGPQGGDELDLIREGANYGWPYVTYGTNYGGRARSDWPLNAVQGRHDGYEQPALAFVTSVGVSNLIQPDPREFPLWRDHLMIGSMRETSLFLVRLEAGSRPVYAEQIRINDVGRVRDIIALADGRIAILTDAGELALLRNEERPPEAVAPREAELVVALAEGSETDVASSPGGAADSGDRLFAAHCGACHGLDGPSAQAPHLAGVLGRRVGGAGDFAYSPTLANLGGTWTRARLIDFLDEPGDEYAGSLMPPVAVDRDEAAAIVDYIAGR